MSNRILLVFVVIVVVSVSVAFNAHSYPRGIVSSPQLLRRSGRMLGQGPVVIATSRFISAGRRPEWQMWLSTDPQSASAGRHSRFHQGRSIADVQAGRRGATYGSKWKQRYFKSVGDDLIRCRRNGTSHTAFGVRIWFSRTRTGGCRSIQPTTCSVQPGRCATAAIRSITTSRRKRSRNGTSAANDATAPAASTSRNPIAANIVNPAKLDFVRANDTCIQCHSQGQPLKNPIEGQYYDWPVGFHQGANLKDYWKLEEHKLGETNFTHFADGTGHKNRMQGNDFVQSVDVHSAA